MLFFKIQTVLFKLVVLATFGSIFLFSVKYLVTAIAPRIDDNDITNVGG